MPYHRTGCTPVKRAHIQAKTVRTTAVSRLRDLQPGASICLIILFLFASPALIAQQSSEQAASEPGFVTLEEVDDAPQLFIPPDPTRPYLDAIDQIEEERGPYVDTLSDLYLGLGEAYLNEGDYESARDAYHRGVMVVRVNSGPNSPEQTNLLYLIANIEMILDEPGQADKIMENIEFINTQYFGEASAELIPVYERIYHWYATTKPLDPEESKMSDYRRIIELTESMVEVNEAVHGPGSLETGLAYRRNAEANFQSLRFTMAEEDWIQPRILVGSDTPYQSTLGYADQSPRDTYGDGKKAFESYIAILEANPEVTPLEHAEALADLADWSLHFEKYRTARKLYEQAYQVLASSQELGPDIQEYLAQPRPMDFAEIEPLPLDGAPLDPDQKRLDVSMTVTRAGDVRYVEILNPPEDLSAAQISKLKREMQDIPFRPGLKEGKAVTTEGFIWQHVFRADVEADSGTEEITS